MKLLREMLDILNESFLIEELGNLKEIDQKFFKVLRTAGRGNLPSGIGKDSKFEDEPFISASDFNNRFTTNISTQGAIIYRVEDGLQIGMIVRYEDKDILSRKSMLIFDAGYLDKDDTKIGTVFSRVESISSSNSVVKSFIISVTSNVDDPTKELRVKYILSDIDRIKKRNDRYQNKEGIIPSKMTAEFERKAKEELIDRLKEFKNSKASVPMKDIIKKIHQDGYLDKIVIDGYEFEYTRSTINFDQTRKPTSSLYGKSEILYTLVDSEKFLNVRRKLWRELETIENLRDDEEAYMKERTKIYKRLKFPPRYVYFELGFEGAALVPVNVRVEYST